MIRVRPNCPSTIPPQFSRQILFPTPPSHLGFTNPNGQGLYSRRSLRSISRAIDEGKRANASVSSCSPWDDKPYELLPDGKRAYLDEQDVVAFLDPPKELIPLDPSSFNPAAYLWLKIEDVPEDRRHRLLHLLEPRLISRAWEIAGTRYEDPMLLKKHASSLLSNGDGVPSFEFWNGRTSGGRSVIAEFASSRYPLYFAVRQHNEVMSTEQPCDLAYEFGDGFLGINEYPPGFPRPAKHPWPFNDQVVIYVRHLGPGVLVGQAWQEGEALEKLPQKLCGEILMVKDYAALREHECG
ncbi:unnamed protein product [Camellia sinensis]